MAVTIRLVGDTLAEAEACFVALPDPCRIATPGHWAERVATGADRKQTSTVRENLSLGRTVIPDELPDGENQLVELAAPRSRAPLSETCAK